MYRAQCSERWILSCVLIILVPPCGCVSLLCLALAQRSRRNGDGGTATAACLERISHTAVAVAFCFLLAANFYSGQLYRTHLHRYLASSNCSAVSRNGTSWTPTIGSFPSQLQVRVDDAAIKQRFVLNDDLSVLQSPVDMEFSVLRRNVNVLPVYHRNAASSSITTAVEP